MKNLKQDFFAKQKVILILLVILLALCYVQFVDRPLKNETKVVMNKITEAEEERDFVQTQSMNLEAMKKRLDELKGLDNLSYMPSYNASEEELNILNNILSGAKHYSVSFSDVTRKGDQVRRNFTITFSVEKYQDAVQILSKLTDSKDRCMVSSVACSSNDREVSTTDESLITVSATATFYETMEGGKEDSLLTEESDETAVDETGN